MRPSRVPIPLLLIIPTTQAILVAPSSPQCANVCGNVLSNTTLTDITCDDAAYKFALSGTTFQSCLSCEMSSTYEDPVTKQTDLQWGLYNLRYTLAACLYGFGNKTDIPSTPCLTSFSCAPLQQAFEHDGLSQDASPYAYCESMDNTASTKCSSCLSEVGNEDYLSNFVTALDAACIQQPAPGMTVSMEGSLFSSTRVNITDPSESSAAEFTQSSSPLSLGDIVGIVVGGVVFLFIVLGCCIIWRGKRRRRRALKARQMQSGYADWLAQQSAVSGPAVSFFDSPQSQRPLNRSWGRDEPQSAVEEPTHFSPYTSPFTSPYTSPYTSPQTSNAGPSHDQWPQGKNLGFVAGHGRGGISGDGEVIEMTSALSESAEQQRWREQAAPVLLHPGHGRAVPRPLTEEDARKGNAL